MAFLINEDRWEAFLEDIEAPMWVDLTLEAKSNKRDNDDNWFYTSHKFHQCSSSELKSAFSHSGYGGDSDLLGGTSSLKLPASVSKSRGKQYKSKKWKGGNLEFSFDKPHPLNALTRKSSRVKQGPIEKSKQKLIYIPKETSISKSSVVYESSSSRKAVSNCCNHPSTSGGVGNSLHSEANKMICGNPTSTVTSETQSVQQKHLNSIDVSSQAYGHSIGLLSGMKIALRKSYITRQATRVEINNDGKQSRGRNSTSSKSSVGSSSNPRYSCRISISKSTSVRPEVTPDSRNVGRTYVAKSRINSSGVVKAPSIKIEGGTSNNNRGGQANTAKLTRQEAAKQKVLYRPRTKALVPSRVNEQDSTVAAAKAKKKAGTGVTKSSNFVGDGKENAMGKMPATLKKFNGRDTAGGDIGTRIQKGTKQSLSGRNDVAGTFRPKGKGRGQGNLEKPRNLTQGVHFR